MKVENHYAMMIRHGERRDYVGQEYSSHKKDPPLSQRGIEMASETGKYIKRQFDEGDIKFEKVIIECSPFLRCMMTAG
jgi:broad specificity phosphatase PhoE